MPVAHAPVFTLAVRGPDASVQLAASEQDAFDYFVYKRSLVNGGPYTAIGVSPTTFLDTNVLIGTTYYYVVSAMNESGESPNSTQFSFSLNAIPPSAPTNVFAAHYDGLLVVISACARDSDHIHHYRFKRSFTPGGPYNTVWLSTDCVFQDSQVSFGRTYYYVVSAVNPNGESLNSAEVSMMPIPEPE